MEASPKDTKKRKISECSDEFSNTERMVSKLVFSSDQEESEKDEKICVEKKQKTEELGKSDTTVDNGNLVSKLVFSSDQEESEKDEKICVEKKQKTEELGKSDTTVDNGNLVPFSAQKHPMTYVETVEELNSLNEHLKIQEAFAFDIEFCGFKTFAGFVCLIQISSRTMDYIIDCVALKKEEIKILESVFNNPEILKVCHGGQNDILWLKKDFDIQVNNLFDTHQASLELNLKGHSMDYLLQQYCKILTEKKYQKADWSIRPLPEEMLKYAQCDSHFLLNICDKMTKELKGKVDQVMERSKLITLKNYTPPTLDTDAFLKLCRKHSAIPASQELLIKALYTWRYNTAKEQDKNQNSLFSNRQIMDIARKAPRNEEELASCVKGASAFFNNNKEKILKVIKESLQKKD